MISRPAIRIRNLGKQYQLGLRERGYKTFREAIVGVARAPWRRLEHLSGRGEAERFWALKDVTFDVAPSEVVGIIGHNGAGKSTLLKILSQITEPTTGEVELRGRVASLLEVGTGFHPELTGRENVFVNGAILGMSRAEVLRKFDEIVEFAGVEEFLDTPIKHYSSGMQVRLAFAVAAHLEPEILIVDEVLAVGDAEFQAKCMGKMGEVASGGRTVLFVSHNMAAIEELCHRACLLDEGRLEGCGPASQMIARYFAAATSLQGDVDLTNHTGRSVPGSGVLRRIRFLDTRQMPSPNITLGADLHIEVQIASPSPIRDAIVVLRVFTPRGLKLFTCSTRNDLRERFDIEGTVAACCTIKTVRLMPGPYVLSIAVKGARGELIDEIASGLAFEVTPGNANASGRLPPAKSGVLVADAHWTVA